jgi:hypothetical protein
MLSGVFVLSGFEVMVMVGISLILVELFLHNEEKK